MPVLSKPAVKVPEFVITQQDSIDICNRLHPDHPQLPLVMRLIRSTTVKKRHLLQPIEETLQHPGAEERHRIYTEGARRLARLAAEEALENAGLGVRDINMIIAVSCTGFLFPSLATYLINDMGFSPHTKQMPIAQMGCTGGGAAINRAREYCLAFPDHNVLIVCVELCSLLYQPTDRSVADLLCDALFGDAAAACVMKGRGDKGLRIDGNISYLIPSTERHIAYDVKETGFHFVLNKEVRNSMGPIADVMRGFLDKNRVEASSLDFCIFHTGGPRILNDLVRLLDIPDERVRHSRLSLAEYGNTASATILDVIRRTFEEAGPHLTNGAKGLLGGFGPGISAEINLNTWLC